MTTAEGSARESLKWRIWRWVKIAFAVFVILFVAAVFWRMPYLAEQDRSAKVAQEIQNSHITMADVDGSHLPPEPDPKLVDATVEGIDANQNGIRDDVELAIFKKYPGDNNLKLRAAELQYAHALQFYLTSVFTSETLVGAMSQQDRASSCLTDVEPSPPASASDSIWNNFFHISDSREKELKDWVINTNLRKSTYDDVFAKFMTSYGSDTHNPCDVIAN